MSEHIQDLKNDEQGKGEGEARSRGSWIPGLVLVGLGIIFLLNNFLDIQLINNWWALFILIPAIVNLNNAWTRYRQAGRWTESAIGSLTGGTLILAVALIFLFELSWGMFWPVLLIILGIGILLRRG